jgi:hypothetical protein
MAVNELRERPFSKGLYGSNGRRIQLVDATVDRAHLKA